ncbi:MAG: methyltransferase domain-containing protein [Burkholderiales bacterium]
MNVDQPKQDSSLADFWNVRYADNTTPWDAGGVPLALQRYLSSHKNKGSVLIPGCGSAYEVKYFHQQGWNTLAMDFSDLAVKRAQANLGELAHLVILGDFFQQNFSGEAFDLVYERTFLCALPRKSWPQYAQRMAQILAPGKILAGFFYFNDEAKGPPFGLHADELESLLAPYFVPLDDQPVPPQESINIMQNRERWQLWQRNNI